MANGPCLNPSCKSHGSPHPNCRCYSYAQGGEVQSYCEMGAPHRPDCEYYAEGGDVESNEPGILDQAVNYVKQRWDQGGNNIHEALSAAKAGNYGPMQNMAVQNAMSTVGSVEVPTGLAGYARSAPGAFERISADLGLTGAAPEAIVKAANEAYQAGKISAQELNQVTNSAAKSRPQYAEGGEVPTNQAPTEASVPIYDISGQQPVLGDMHPDDVHDAVASGKYSLPKGSVPAFNPDGELGDIPAEDAPHAFQNGYKYATPSAIERHHYESPGQQAATVAEGLVSGVISRPVTSAIEQATGISTGKDILNRQKYNPVESAGSEAVGLVGGALTGTGEAALLEKAGVAAAKLLGPKGAGALAKIGARSISDATQMVIYQGGNEVSRLIEGDPTQSLGAATADIGLSGVLGAGLGAAFGSVSPLWKATIGPKAEQLASDFSSRLKFLKDNPNLNDALTEELTAHHTGIASAEKNVSEALASRAESSGESNQWMLDDILAKKNGGTAKLQQKFETAQEAFSSAKTAFEKRFGSEVEGMPVDPGKVEDYLSKLDKPSGATSKKVLTNFLEASERYTKVLKDAHSELGIEAAASPSTHIVQSTLEKSPPGAKLADFFVKQGIDKLSGHALGGAAGAALGHSTGIPGAGTIGAVLGERVLGPAFESTIHSIVKPLLESATSSAGLKAAVDYSLAVAKGETLMNKAAKNLFRPTGEILAESAIPDEAARKKLDIQLQKIERDPSKLTAVGGDIGHYMPHQASAMASTAAQASQYLNNLRPKQTSTLPLDSKLPPNPVAQAQYHRALDIAIQPLSVVHSIAKGTITPQDVLTLKAINPGAHDRLKTKLVSHMTEAISKGETIPYKTRIGMSMFLGQPLDSTLTQSAILNAQPRPPQPQAPSPMSPGSRPKSSTSKLGAVAKQTQTQGQAREARADKS